MSVGWTCSGELRLPAVVDEEEEEEGEWTSGVVGVQMPEEEDVGEKMLGVMTSGRRW